MRSILMLLFLSCFSILKTAGQKKVWFDINWNGTTKEKATYYNVFSNLKYNNELVVYYYVSGKKAKESYFVKGKKEGQSVDFYATGEIKVVGKYEGGFREGMWKTYYNNGKMKEKGRYSKGEKIGVWKLFYKNN